MNKVLLLTALTVATFGVIFMFNTAAIKADNDSVNVCHKTSSGSNPWVTQSVSANQLQSHLDNGDFLYTGPVDSHGHPTGNDSQWCADHAVQPTATPTPTHAPTSTPTQAPTATPTTKPTATPTQTPTATPTAGVTATPTPTTAPCNNENGCVTATPTSVPTATPTTTSNGGSTPPNNPSDGKSDGKSSCPECTQAPQQAVLGASTAVLGASTFADTGTFADNTMNLVLFGGILFLALGATAYAKEKKA